MRLWKSADDLTVTKTLVLAKNCITTLIGGMLFTPVTIAADITLTNVHSGRPLLLGEVGGNADVMVTLPKASGSGATFAFIVSVAMASNDYAVQVASAADIMQGIVSTASTTDTPDLAQPWVTTSTSDTITLNGGTTGGLAVGDYFTLTDIADGVYAVSGFTSSVGASEATPFSAAVS